MTIDTYMHNTGCNHARATHSWFEVTHLEVNTWFMSIVNMFFDINVIHVLNSTLNACLSGRYKITFVGCSSFQ